jgi:DNA modification methylase
MSGKNFLDGKVTLLCGDSSELIKGLPENSIDAVVCDPPYALVSIVKRFGGANAAPAKGNEAYQRASAGFMGKTWDTGEVAFSEAFWADVLRVLKPGGHLVAFSGTRTYHRMAVAIEDAGFEIRDQLAWCYGSGFPKSHDVSKGIDKRAGAEREKVKVRHSSQSLMTKDGQNERPWQEAAKVNGFHELAGPEAVTDEAKAWSGWGTALKPSWEPICLARKALIGTVAANVLEHGVGALNIDGCRVETADSLGGGRLTGATKVGEGWDRPWMSDPERRATDAAAMADKVARAESLGRWPTNLIHDGSEEVVGAFPDTNPSTKLNCTQQAREPQSKGAERARVRVDEGYEDSGSAARFFYTAKADAEDRLGSKHPTVKPVDLMQWLCRLVCPKGGTVLDPFAGTGTTGEAAWREGMRAILMEREPEYQEDISRRMELAVQPTKRAAVAASKNNLEKAEDLPLFALLAE